MAWVTPITWTLGQIVTYTQLNTIRDALNETAPAKATTATGYFVATGVNAIAQRVAAENLVATSETTASTSYTDLATSGPSVTVTTGAAALVIVNARQENNSANASYAGFEVSGATTYAGGDSNAVTVALSAGLQISCSRATLFTATPGSNTFKMNYRVGGGTGTFQNRRIVVMPY